MRKILFLTAIISLFGLFSLTAFAQIKPTLISGDIVSVSAEKIVLKTANGDVEAVLSESTKYLRVPPENPKLTTATPSSFSEIGVGDKVIISVIMPEDKKTIPVRTVYLMSKAAIDQRQAKEKEEWRTRGISGRVDSYNPQTNVITVTVRGLAGERKVLVTPKDQVEFYRYAQDSVKFSEAKKGTIADLEPGDSIRALGDKNADGSELKAEKIVTGAFKTVGGTITAVNAEKNEITINDFQTKKDVTIVVTDASILKQFPAEMAQRMASFQMGGGGQGGFRPPTPGGGQTNPQPNTQAQGGGQTPNGGGGFRAGGGGIDDMLDRFPTVKVADLKVGEMIAVSSTKSSDPTRIKAIKLLSGVEPFIKMQQMAQAGQGGGNRGGGGGASLNIPGLDGFGGN